MGERLSHNHLLALLLAGGLCLLVFLGKRVLTEHEVFAAEPAREMLAGRGWVLQPFAGEYRTKKPPGQSWLIAASLAVTRSQSEWTARLPSALAGIGLAVVTAVITARLSTSRRGLIAGLMVLTCVGVQQRARLAEADMALAFFVALANASLLFLPLPLWEGAGGGVFAVPSESADLPEDGGVPPRPLPLPPPTRGGGKGAAVLYWLAVVAGFMIKGPIVWGFTLLPALIAWAVLRFGSKNPEAATAVRRVAFWWPAIVVGMALIVAWPVAAYRQYPAAAAEWKHQIVDRVFGKLGHVEPVSKPATAPTTSAKPAGKDNAEEEGRHDPLLSYGWLLPQSALPWFPFAVVGACLGWRYRKKPAHIVLLCWAGCGFVLVSAIAFKVLHYVLPITAAVLMLAAYGFEELLNRFVSQRPAASKAKWETASLVGWFGVAIAGWMVWNGKLEPAKDWGTKVRDFAVKVDAAVPAGETIYYTHRPDGGPAEDQTAWYLHHPLRQATGLPASPAYLICSGDDLQSIPKMSHATVLLTADPVLASGGANRNDRVLVRLGE